MSAIFEIVRSDLHSCIVFIGEMSLFCFSLEGEAMWKNDYRTIIFNWAVKEEGIFVEFEDGKKVLVSFKNGNGVTIV